MEDILEKIKEKRVIVENKLKKRRLDMADQDSRNVSRYITATRWMVEQEINSLDEELARLDRGIKEISRLMKTEKRFDGKYFVTDEFEYLELGIISKQTPMGGKILKNLKSGT